MIKSISFKVFIMKNLAMNFLSAFIVIILPCFIEGQDYCSVCEDHTMCKYPNVNSLGYCEQIFAQGVNENDIQFILQKHNDLRSMLAQGQESRGVDGGQPSAANMRQIRWNPELATIAQRWADQCLFEHDSCRNTQSEPVGQNIYISYNSENTGDQTDFNSALNAFWDEVQLFSRDNIQPYKFALEYGHYSQMAWADTYEIGCGYIHYFGNNQYNKYYVCNYGPTGNYIDGEMYKEGPPCSACPDGTNCNQETKLCE